MTMSGRRWLIIFVRHGVDGQVYPGFWIRRGQTLGPLFWIIDLGDEPQGWEYSWRIPPQGGPLSGGNVAEKRNGGAVETTASGRSDGGDGIIGGGEIFPLLPENHRPVYCDLYDTGSMSEGRMADGSMGDTAVVGAGRSRRRPRGRKDSEAGDRDREIGWIGYGGSRAEGGCGVRGKTIHLNEEDRVK